MVHILRLTTDELQIMLALLILFLPCGLLLPAWLASYRSSKINEAWQLAQMISLLGLLLALLCGLLVINYGVAIISATPWLPTIRLDALSFMMLALTTFLGWVVVRYSRNYMDGDNRQDYYLTWLCLTLASVWLLVTLNNLLLISLCWTATSLTLHKLLTFYRERPAATMAAHKKFLISRIADVLTYTAVLLVYLCLDTLQTDRIIQIFSNANPLDPTLKIALLLLVLSAILKCAQLPFHGWLLQVMEAPTPISALLHAGIVNIGGFILLRFSPLLEITPTAQLFLVVAGSLTATLASLVMMTRISIKVMLAWSTCAQMGYMLLEIGLGAYSLALLHLIAHSLYKAYCFLSAGETVVRQRKLDIAQNDARLSASLYLFALVGLMLAFALAGFFTDLNLRDEPAMWLLGGVLVSSLLPLVSAPAQIVALRQVFLLLVYAFCLALLYGVWHSLFAKLMPFASKPPTNIGLGFASICLLSLLVVQQIVLAQPQGLVSRWLHPRAFAGFHLDEIVSYLMLRIWPAKLTTLENTPPTPFFRPNFNKENI